MFDIIKAQKAGKVCFTNCYQSLKSGMSYTIETERAYQIALCDHRKSFQCYKLTRMEEFNSIIS